MPIPPLTLYDLDADLLALEGELLAAAGETDAETDARHAALLDARADKVEAYCRLIRRFEATAEAVKAERQRLQAAERALCASADRLKARLCESMRARGHDEALTALGKVRVLCASRRSVEVLVEPDALPEPYRRLRLEADLRALADDLGSDDEATRARAEAVARLADPTFYVRLY